MDKEAKLKLLNEAQLTELHAKLKRELVIAEFRHHQALKKNFELAKRQESLKEELRKVEDEHKKNLKDFNKMLKKKKKRKNSSKKHHSQQRSTSSKKFKI